MEWTTHALSGVVSGYLVTGGDWKGAIVGGVTGVIPDLDEPKSKFGKVLLPISVPLNKIFGHRTFTHSLLFAVLMGAILFPFTERWIWLASVVGILAHVAGDMMTGKVYVLYPMKKPIGIPVSRTGFLLIDRIVRFGLGVVVLFVLGKEALYHLRMLI